MLSLSVPATATLIEEKNINTNKLCRGYMGHNCAGEDVETVENTTYKAVPKETIRCCYAVTYTHRSSVPGGRSRVPGRAPAESGEFGTGKCSLLDAIQSFDAYSRLQGDDSCLLAPPFKSYSDNRAEITSCFLRH